MNTQTILMTPSHSTRHSPLLAALPAGMIADREIPWESALEVVIPLILLSDPSRAAAIPLFREWIKARDLTLSVRNIVWLWENFAMQYWSEFPKRVSQWRFSKNVSGLKTPLQLLQEMLDIWTLTVFRPWKADLQSTPMGKVAYGFGWVTTLLMLLFVLAPAVILAMSYVLRVGAYVGEALKHSLGLLGF